MTNLIEIVKNAIETAVQESTVVASSRGTARNISRAITKAVDGDAETYDGIKDVVSSFYETHPLDTSAKDAVNGMLPMVTTVILAISSRKQEASTSKHAEMENVVVVPEKPTVEKLSEVLVNLGKRAESAPEFLNDDIQHALRRFGLN